MKDMENALLAVSNSLTRIVGPAVADHDPLAQQQLALSLAYLGLIRDRMPHLAARERFDLEENLHLARSVDPHLPSGAAITLREVMDEAELLLEGRADAGQDVRRLSARIQALVSEAFESVPVEVAPALEHAVVAASHSRVELDRAWFLPMGFDPDPGSVRPLDELLGERRGAAS